MSDRSAGRVSDKVAPPPVAESTGEGGLSGFAANVWARTKDAASAVGKAARPVAGEALEAGKSVVSGIRNAGEESGVTRDVVDAAKRTGQHYKKDGVDVVNKARNGDLVGAGVGALRLGVEAQAGPLTAGARIAGEVADKQAERHLTPEQRAKLKVAKDAVVVGTQLTGGNVEAIATGDIKGKVIQKALENPEAVKDGVAKAGTAVKNVFGRIKSAVTSDDNTKK